MRALSVSKRLGTERADAVFSLCARCEEDSSLPLSVSEQGLVSLSLYQAALQLSKGQKKTFQSTLKVKGLLGRERL